MDDVRRELGLFGPGGSGPGEDIRASRVHRDIVIKARSDYQRVAVNGRREAEFVAHRPVGRGDVGLLRPCGSRTREDERGPGVGHGRTPAVTSVQIGSGPGNDRRSVYGNGIAEVVPPVRRSADDLGPMGPCAARAGEDVDGPGLREGAVVIWRAHDDRAALDGQITAEVVVHGRVRRDEFRVLRHRGRSQSHDGQSNKDRAGEQQDECGSP